MSNSTRPFKGSTQKEKGASSILVPRPTQREHSRARNKNNHRVRDIARDLELWLQCLKKQDLVFRLLQNNTEQQGNIFSAGVLEIVEMVLASYVRSAIYQETWTYSLAVADSPLWFTNGDMVSGQVRPPRTTKILWSAACRSH